MLEDKAAIDYETADFYTDVALVDDPHAYFAFLRNKGPVTKLPYRNVMAVTGYEEMIQLSLDTEHFSTINSVVGAMIELPFEVKGDDISAELLSPVPGYVAVMFMGPPNNSWPVVKSRAWMRWK